MDFQLRDTFGYVPTSLHTPREDKLLSLLEAVCNDVKYLKSTIATQQKEISDLNNQLKTFNKIIKGSPKGVEKEDLVTFYTQKNRAKMILKGKGN